MRKLSKSALIAMKKLNDKGYEAFVVGGAIRDLLLNKKVYDYDIATNADPNAIKMVFEDFVKYDVGKKHGTVSILIDKDKIDITPYRKEADYKDHRHPDQIAFSNDLLEDLSRRDFTINALCMDKDRNVIDHFDGIDDLNNRLIRSIGDPDRRFNEDALRILRAIRFKAKLDFEIEEKTNRSIHRNKDLLTFISPERKKDELLKILSSRSAFKLINEYIDVFGTFMPFGRTIRKINNFSDPFYALAFLLKDKEVDLKSLKYSNDEARLIKILQNSMNINIENDYEFIETLSCGQQKDILRFLEEYHHKDLSERYRKLKRYMATIDDLKISGQEIRSYGYSGKQIGKVKQQLLELVHRKKLNNTSYCLNKYLRENVVE